MSIRSSKVIVAQMNLKEQPSWINEQKHMSNRLLRNTALFAAGSLCLGLCVWGTVSHQEDSTAVMSHLTSGFEYDESLGRLQLVSNMLPESAMVFLDTQTDAQFQAPTGGEIVHTWSEKEPWIAYNDVGTVSACEAGEIMTVIKNHAGLHTVRILHDNEFESIYSGLKNVELKEHDFVEMGQILGTAGETASFEIRRNGISILPTFCAN